MSRTRDEIDQEKAHKSRPDLLPASALMAAGCVMGYGSRKHGDCTWRVAGTKQADSREHVASMMRHAIRVADDIDSVDEDGLEDLACVITQACIAYDCRVAERKRAAAAWASTPSTIDVTDGAVTVGSAFAAGQIEGEAPRSRCLPFVGGCPTPYTCSANVVCKRDGHVLGCDRSSDCKAGAGCR